MGLLGKLAEITLKTVTLPVDVAKDVVTLGGAITDGESAIKKKCGSISEDIDKLGDE